MPVQMRGTPGHCHVPGIPGVRERARLATAETPMVFDVNTGGWHDTSPQRWSTQPTAMGESIQTNWSPLVRSANRNVRGGFEVDEPFTPSATFEFVPKKYEQGVLKQPWAAPPPNYSVENSLGYGVTPKAFAHHVAPGTDISTRGGWPIEETFRPDGTFRSSARS